MLTEKPDKSEPAAPSRPLAGAWRRLFRVFAVGNAVAFGLGVFFSVPAARSDDTQAATKFRQQIAAAVAEVSQGKEDGLALKALIAALPRDPDDKFMIEGDLALSQAELIDHLTMLAPGVVRRDDNSELLLATIGGVFSYYDTRSERHLTYAVDKASFASEARYDEVVSFMEQATGAWVAACRACQIEFFHVTALDTASELSPGTSELNFVVRYRDVASTFLAEAFYPYNDGSDRILNIYPGFFTANYPKAGILTHEVGHILGYRHEQIRGVPGCGLPGSDFAALTDYDNKSIMHYFCGEGGNPKMVLSDTDKQGHRLIYQPVSQ